jgi:hypothetical protein
MSRLHDFASLANVYRSWGIKAVPTQLVLGSGDTVQGVLNNDHR